MWGTMAWVEGIWWADDIGIVNLSNRICPEGFGLGTRHSSLFTRHFFLESV